MRAARRFFRRQLTVRGSAGRAVALFVYATTCVGAPVGVSPGKDGSIPFPCQTRNCSCRNAEQCFRSCRCFSAEARSVWFAERNISFPDAREWSRPRSTDAAGKTAVAASCCEATTASVDTGPADDAPASCCGGSSAGSGRRASPVGWNSSPCSAAQATWLSIVIASPPLALITSSSFDAVGDWVRPLDGDSWRLPQVPPVPPPRS